jgi:hypothetical protein
MSRSNPYVFTIYYHLPPDIRRVVTHPLQAPYFSNLNMRGLCSCDLEYFELSAIPSQCYWVQKRVGNLNTMKTVCVSYITHLCVLHSSPLVSCIRINVKLSVSTLQRNIGGAEVQLHSVLTSVLVGVSSHHHTPAALPPDKNPGTHCIRGWMFLRPAPDVLERRKLSSICRDLNPVPSSF